MKFYFGYIQQVGKGEILMKGEFPPGETRYRLNILSVYALMQKISGAVFSVLGYPMRNAIHQNVFTLFT